MKIGLLSLMSIPHEYVDASFAMFRPSFERVLREGTEVVFLNPARALSGNVADPDNLYFSLLNRQAMVEGFLDAERAGCDAAIVGCFGDPGVREARAVVDIPVFGPGESAMHFACQIGRRFAVIGANMPGQQAQILEQVRAAGLESRLIPNGVRVGSDFVANWERWAADPQTAADDVAQVAAACVRDGADCIVVGCAGLGPLCTLAGFTALTTNGQHVPIVDPVTVAIKTAEMAVDIRRGTGLPIPARAGNLVLPAREDWCRVRQAFGLSA